MKRRYLVLLALCAALCFGGTFECKSGDDDDGVRLISKPTTRD